MALQNVIHNLLTQKGITAYQFIKDTGISDTTGYDLAKNPNHLPSITVIGKICKAYQIQPNDIVINTDETPN